MAQGTFQVSSPFGMRAGVAHRGMDLAAPSGTPIFSAMDGVVREAGPASGFGMWIVVDSVTLQGRVSTVYGHMYPDGVLVRAGQEVKAGDQIALVGSNGQSSGPHLHFEYWQGGRLDGGSAADPAPLLASAKDSGGTAADVAAAIANCAVGDGPAGRDLKPGMVPPEFEPWIIKAAQTCPGTGITAPLLAAQIKQESGFRAGNITSPAGAQGPAQFMPGTWRSYQMDFDGNGTMDVLSIPDAVGAQARLMCDNLAATTRGLDEGRLDRTMWDATDLALAAYNAGMGKVLGSRGMPSDPGTAAETVPYVENIRRMEKEFAVAGKAGAITSGGEGTVQAAAAALLGQPYVWGGGNADGPAKGGFDSPGLTYYAVTKALGANLLFPRTVQQQWSFGREVPLNQVRAGDLVFSGFDSGGRPARVGIAVEPNRIVHAAAGSGVVNGAIEPGAKARRVVPE